VGQRPLITDLSVHIAPGERWVLLGVNGCGKSTLLRALAGLPLAPAIALDCAARRLDNTDLATLSLAQLAKRRAVVPQQADIATFTQVSSVLALAGAARADLAARQWNVAQLLPQTWASLSGGERARVLLAACAAQGTQAALLDEPFAAMDWGEALLAVDRVKAWAGTLIAVMHDVNLAQRLATHALLFLPGGQWAAGPVEEVFTEALLSQCLAVRLAQAQVQVQAGAQHAAQRIWHAA
jgi:iron complex transport system ATP-binding protein